MWKYIVLYKPGTNLRRGIILGLRVYLGSDSGLSWGAVCPRGSPQCVCVLVCWSLCGPVWISGYVRTVCTILGVHSGSGNGSGQRPGKASYHNRSIQWVCVLVQLSMGGLLVNFTPCEDILCSLHFGKINLQRADEGLNLVLGFIWDQDQVYLGVMYTKSHVICVYVLLYV